MIKLHKPPCPNPRSLNRGNYKHSQNKKALEDASFSKCIYCESKITHTDYGDVEHIKPKSGFPELEFDWDNLGFVCRKCNDAKSNIYDESCEPINPYAEDPGEHIQAIGSWVSFKNNSERGKMTITLVDLNREQLIQRRLDLIKEVETAIAAANSTNSTMRALLQSGLRDWANDSVQYSMVARAVLEAHAII